MRNPSGLTRGEEPACSTSTAVQKSLAEFGLDGWLLYDFRGSNVLARRVLGLDQKPAGTRRFFYPIPAPGTPRKLVHRIETAALDHLPGEKSVYLPWQELEAGVADLVDGLPAGGDGVRPARLESRMSRRSTPAPSSWSAPPGSRSSRRAT